VNNPLVEVKNVDKIFNGEKKYAIKDLSFSIPKGKIFGLVGPDGSGKTTLLRLMAGLLKPSKGNIFVEGFDTIKNAEKVHEILGYMPQKFGLYEDLSVIQNLELFSSLKGLKKEYREQVYEKLLKFTDLGLFKERLAKNLSGGMKQKLGLACALVTRPRLLLLDEPSVGVDPISRKELWKMVYELLDNDICVVWSTSYLDEAEKCDEVMVLNEGEIVFLGPPNELTKEAEDKVFLIKNPSDKRKLQIELLNNENFIDVQIQGRDLRVVQKEAKKDILKGDIEPLKPKFEDAFISMLGGLKTGLSPVSAIYAPIIENLDTVIEARKLVKCFGNFRAADNIDLKIRRQEIFGLLGPNGAGKTTTFKMLCGLVKPTKGIAYVNGFDFQKAPGFAREKIGYMAQKFSLYNNLNAFQNMEFFAGAYGLSGKKRKIAIEKMVEAFDLKPFLNEITELMPLGFKQRLALCCAIMHEPSILFLDEPTSGVDPITRREFWQHIYGLVEKGVTIMVTTHFMEEAEYCDRLGLVYKSRLIKVETPEKLKEISGKKNIEEAFISLIEAYETD
jgi:ABC-2 type transport system ATP-binding protein